MQKEVHILVLSSWYPSQNKPFLGNFVQRQAELLASRYKISVLHTNSDHSADRIEIKETQDGALTQIIVDHPKGNSLFARKRNQKKAFKQGLNRINDVDIIIGNVLLPRGHQFVTALKKFNCPLFYIEHGSYFGNNKSHSWSAVDRILLKMVKKRAAEVIAVSELLKEDMKRDFQNFDIRVIGNHVASELFQSKVKEIHPITEFLHVSTMDVRTKNPEGILNACLLVKKQTSNFILTIISDEDVSRWKAWVSDKALDENIRFIGPLEWSKLVPHYQKSDALVVFSNYESFSIVIAEAWMTGTPVISTSVGIAHNMDASLGIQIEKNNPERLSHAMLSLMNKEISFDQDVIIRHAAEFGDDVILNKWSETIERHVG